MTDQTSSFTDTTNAFLRKLPGADSEYFRLSRTAKYSFLIALPLFVLYEILIFFVNFNESQDLGLSVEFLFKKMMISAGNGPMLGLSVAVLLIGMYIFYQARNQDVPIKRKYFGRMILESLILAFVMGVLVSMLVGSVFGVWLTEVGQITFNRLGFLEMLTLSIGAGLYEEFFFRLLLVGGLFLLVRQFYDESKYGRVYLIVAVIGALIFSGVHYIGSMGDDFTLASFTFRFLLGLALNAIFLLRGFGIAAWTHSLYDILVTLMT